MTDSTADVITRFVLDQTPPMLPELKPGKETSEKILTDRLMIAGVLLAVAASFGKVPFTPDDLATYLKHLVAQATTWSKVLLPYIVMIQGFYLTTRHRLKSRHIDASKEVALKNIEAAVTAALKATGKTAVLIAFIFMFAIPQIASARQLIFRWLPASELEAVQGYTIHYGLTAENIFVGEVDCGLPPIVNNRIVHTINVPDDANCFGITAYRDDVHGPINDIICLDNVPGEVDDFQILMLWPATPTGIEITQ